MVWHSSDSRSSSSSMASPPLAAAAEDDRMVTEELEAAEALADLAMRGGDCGTSSGKRVKSESPPSMEASESVTRFSNLLPLERTVQLPEKAGPNAQAETSNARSDHSEMNLNDAKLPNTGLVSSPFGCGKSRRNLTEAEKEERRMRRILANRESARQTIRRRQALCEELSKKAEVLTLENESLKTEMKAALSTYQMLETANKELRNQVASAEAGENPSRPNCSSTVHVPQTSAPPPLILYNHPPFLPIFWPPISQSQIPVETPHVSQSTVLMPSNINGSCEQENLVNTSSPTTPYYILPYPWFFPQNDNAPAIHPTPPNFQNIEQETTPHVFFPVKVKAEPSGLHEAGIPNDLNEPPEGFPQELGDQNVGSYLDRILPTETCLEDSSPNSVKHENDIAHCFETSPEVCHSPYGSGPQEMYCEPVIFSCNKSAEAVAAAEARKRRKELTKLKSLHGRQCRMHC